MGGVDGNAPSNLLSNDAGNVEGGLAIADRVKDACCALGAFRDDGKLAASLHLGG